MKPIKFKEQNIIFAENQQEYEPLPACKLNNASGDVISCWKLSFKEKLRILITGKLWVRLSSFHKPLTPSYFTTKKTDLFEKQN